VGFSESRALTSLLARILEIFSWNKAGKEAGVSQHEDFPVHAFVLKPRCLVFISMTPPGVMPATARLAPCRGARPKDPPHWHPDEARTGSRDRRRRSRCECRGFAPAQASSIPARTGACTDSPATVRWVSLAGCRTVCPGRQSDRDQFFQCGVSGKAAETSAGVGAWSHPPKSPEKN
jgi:hypothetical protein